MVSGTSGKKLEFANRVFGKSCLDMSELPDGVVSLTVTSPPYWNAIDYDRHIENPDENYRTRQYSVGFGDYGEYLQWLDAVCAEVFRVTKPGGFMALVVGTVLFEGKHYPLPFDLVSMLSRSARAPLGDEASAPVNGEEELGGDQISENLQPKASNMSCWQFHQDILWHKVTGGVTRAGVFIQNPYPGYFYPNIMTEYILVFKKPGPPIYKDKDLVQKEGSKVAIDRLFTNDVANTVWHIAPVPPGYLNHPCPFPEEIPYRLIQLYSYVGDLVLDPFCGSGQTLKVAKHLGRSYTGYDINRKYVDLAQTRIEEPLSIRKEQLIATFEKI